MYVFMYLIDDQQSASTLLMAAEVKAYEAISLNVHSINLRTATTYVRFDPVPLHGFW